MGKVAVSDGECEEGETIASAPGPHDTKEMTHSRRVERLEIVKNV